MDYGWLRSLKGYISLLNQLHIDGDASDLQAWCQDSEYAKRECERLSRHREMLNWRKAKALKSKTVVRNFQVISEGPGEVRVKFIRYMWKLYHINEQFMEQEDEQAHYILLKEHGGKWMIESDLTADSESNKTFSTAAAPVLDHEAVPVFQQEPPRSSGYDRAKVKRYADLWWNDYNPEYPQFEVDCTNFASQCLHAGGLPMEYTNRRDLGWWANKNNWSYSWAVAHSLMTYLTGGNTKRAVRAEVKESADQLLIGDIICYDWDGNGNFQHNTVVVAKDPNGMPLVNAHTINSRNRYWEYLDSYAWTPNTAYKFIHIKE